MASGHVNRANRPNTWLHRPATRREDSPCQLGAVHTWHMASFRCCAAIWSHLERIVLQNSLLRCERAIIESK